MWVVSTVQRPRARALGGWMFDRIELLTLLSGRPRTNAAKT
jgi:hypothetical protein